MGAQFKSIFVATIIFCSGLTFTSHNAYAKNACDSDEQTLCKGVEKGKGRILKCLVENKAKLSQPCKDQISKVKNKMQDLKKVCEADSKKFCADVPKGRGALMKCMKSHKEELSAPCHQGINEMKKMAQGE